MCRSRLALPNPGLWSGSLVSLFREEVFWVVATKSGIIFEKSFFDNWFSLKRDDTWNMPHWLPRRQCDTRWCIGERRRTASDQSTTGYLSGHEESVPWSAPHSLPSCTEILTQHLVHALDILFTPCDQVESSIWWPRRCNGTFGSRKDVISVSRFSRTCVGEVSPAERETWCVKTVGTEGTVLMCHPTFPSEFPCNRSEAQEPKSVWVQLQNQWADRWIIFSSLVDTNCLCRLNKMRVEKTANECPHLDALFTLLKWEHSSQRLFWGYQFPLSLSVTLPPNLTWLPSWKRNSGSIFRCFCDSLCRSDWLSARNGASSKRTNERPDNRSCGICSPPIVCWRRSCT